VHDRRQADPGYHVAKGEELGYFQYGGSTHCLVFRPGAIAEFSLTAVHSPMIRSRRSCASAPSSPSPARPPDARAVASRLLLPSHRKGVTTAGQQHLETSGAVPAVVSGRRCG
jgi:Phosphatidylserine decarboxylase